MPIKITKPVDPKLTEALNEATNEDGTIDASKLGAPPPAAPPSNLGRAVEVIKEHRGLTDEELARKEYLLKTTHTLLLHNATTSQIAAKLNLTTNEVRNLKRELNSRIIAATRNLDKHELAGKTLMFYDHIIAEAMKVAGNIPTLDENGKPTRGVRTKLEAYKVAIQSQTDKQRFLIGAGFWNNGMSDRDDTNSHVENANEIRDILQTVLNGDTFEFVGKEDDIGDDGIDIL